MLSLKRQNEVIRALHTRLDKYERWQALYDVRRNLSEGTFLKTFVDVWVDSESNDIHLSLIDELIDEFGICAERVLPFLSKRDRKIFLEMPNLVSVYRGTTEENPYSDHSWSYDEAQALWFAERSPHGVPALVTGVVAKRDMIFVTDQRGEKEVAANVNMVAIKSFEIVGDFRKDPFGVFFFEVQAKGALRDVLFKAQAQSLLLNGLSPVEAERRLLQQVDDLEAFGFLQAAKDRRDNVEQIDWDEVSRSDGTFKIP